MGRSGRAATVLGAVALTVGSVVAGGTAWSLGASTGATARPVSTTEDPPTWSRTKTITFDADAQLHALIDLPDPLPPLTEDAECIDLAAHDGTWPVFNGSLITVPGYSAHLCPQYSIGVWSVGWYGTSQGQTGDAYLSGSATFIIEPDGTPGPRMLASVTSGKHRYQYIPESDADDDRYVLSDSYFGDLVSTTLSASGNPETAPTQPPGTTPGTGTRADAAPAVPVSGTAGYTG